MWLETKKEWVFKMKNNIMRKILKEFVTVLKLALYLVIAGFIILAGLSITSEVVIYFMKNPILGIN